jgi:hypothetical protein
VKSVESKLHSYDGIDGSGSSKLSGAAHVADTQEKGIIGELIKKEENELDHVERGSYLQDVRQNRAKAPKRRPPTSAGSLIGDSNNNINGTNGNHHNSDNSLDSNEAIVSSQS